MEDNVRGGLTASDVRAAMEENDWKTVTSNRGQRTEEGHTQFDWN